MTRNDKKSKGIFRKILKWTFQATPMGVLVILGTGVIHSVFLVLQTICMQLFFDQVTNGNSVDNILIYALILSGVMIASLVFDGIHNAVIESTSFKVTKNFMQRLQNQVAKFRAEYYEDTEFIDQYTKAEKGVEQSVFFMNVCFIIATYYIPYFTLMGLYLIFLKTEFIVILLFVFLPVFIQQRYRSKCFFEMEENIVKERRKYKHYEECIISKEYFKETRILGAYTFFYKIYQKTLKSYDDKEWQAQKKSGIRQIIMKSITLIGYCMILIMLVLEVWNLKISVGTFVALFSSLHTMFRLMEELLCGHISRLSENYASICNYVLFVEIEKNCTEKHQSILQSKKIDKLPEIRVEHVSYIYPNSKKKVLEDISFVIHPGETVAIVGENGAGKSTLLKLLCGQYLPTEGEIYIQGISTKVLNWEEISFITSAVFQNYVKYGMTLMENVIISETQNFEGKKDDDEIYSKKAMQILNKNGFPLERMPNGMETMLFHQFGGIDLSGGQWQKIAISRGCFRERKLFFLDEPTASIDPIEEKNIYELFHDICQNKTAIIITHRLASAREADKIFVLDNHKLSEKGTHEELIQKNGVYKKMYLTQKEMYKMNSE